jgi:hypothetical protein
MTLRPIRGMLCAGFLVALATFLGAVFLESFYPVVKLAMVDEHRQREPPPPIHLLLKQDASDFATRLNRWIDDQTGFRELFIAIKNQIDYSVFGVSRRVYIGLNGMLFLRLYTDLRLEIERIPETQYYALEQSFVELSRVVRDKGAKLVVVMTPDKSAIYPEFLPSNVPILPTAGRLEKLREFLGRQPDILFVDADMLIRQSKKNDILMFAKTDLHTTTRAAAVVLPEIIRRIAQSEARPDIAFRDEFNWQFYEQPGGIDARFLGIIHPLTEMYESPIPIYLIGSDHSEEGEWIPKDPRGVFDWEFVARPGTCAHKLPATLLYGDSFSDLWWALGMHKYFCSIRRSRNKSDNDNNRFRQYVAEIPAGTRYFIFQIQAPSVVGLAPVLRP